METNNHKRSTNSKSTLKQNSSNKKIETIIDYGQTKMKQIGRRILEKEIKLESMEPYQNYEHIDVLREYIEAEKEHQKDLKLFVDLLSKYKIIVK